MFSDMFTVFYHVMHAASKSYMLSLLFFRFLDVSNSLPAFSLFPTITFHRVINVLSSPYTRFASFPLDLSISFFFFFISEYRL